MKPFHVTGLEPVKAPYCLKAVWRFSDTAALFAPSHAAAEHVAVLRAQFVSRASCGCSVSFVPLIPRHPSVPD